ncbi:MAG: hypothetical protein KDB23_10980, partial [Planctomycetales bacterium]|nr:hypothetical protein [Planctomycetales bacterium]
MSENFDPYYQWLGIRDAERPPNHYRLLGIDLFESNEEVIHTAADRQMAHLRTFQNGPRAELSQRLLNEIAAAKLCLLDDDKRHVYEEWLRARQAPGEDLAPDLPTINVATPMGYGLHPPGKSTRETTSKRPWLIAAVSVGCVLLLLFGYRYYRDHVNTPQALRDSVAASTGSDSVETLPEPVDPDRRESLPTPPTADAPDEAGSVAAEDANESPPQPATETVPDDGDTADVPTDGGANATATSDRDTSADDTPGTTDTPENDTPDVTPTPPERINVAVPTVPTLARWSELPAADEGRANRFAISDAIGGPLTLLANRDLVGAESALQNLARNPSPQGSRADVRDAQMILAALDQFWTGIAEAQKAVVPGDTLMVRQMPAKVVTRGTTYLKLSDPEGNQQVFDTRRGEIHPAIAIALAENHFAESLPTAWRLAATFLSVDHQGDPALADAYVALAQSSGVSSEFVTRVVKQLRGELDVLPPLPAIPDKQPDAPSTAGRSNGSQAKPSSLADDQNPKIPSKTDQADARRKVYSPLLQQLKADDVPVAQWPTRLLEAASADLAPAERYVLVKAALQRATLVPDLDTALKAVDALALDFEMDVDELRYKTMQAIGRRVKANDRRPYVSLIGNWIDASVQADQYANAVRLAELADTLGKVVPDTFYRRRLARRRSELLQLKSMAEQIAPVREQLNREPNNAEAKLAVARFQVLGKGDFDGGGLQLLSDASEEPLREAVSRELNGVSTVEEQLELGTSWYSAARSLRGVERVNALRRAQMWLTTAAES